MRGNDAKEEEEEQAVRCFLFSLEWGGPLKWLLIIFTPVPQRSGYSINHRPHSFAKQAAADIPYRKEVLNKSEGIQCSVVIVEIRERKGTWYVTPAEL